MKEAYLNAKANKPDTNQQLLLLPEERPSLTLIQKPADRISWRLVVAAALVSAGAFLALRLQFVYSLL